MMGHKRFVDRSLRQKITAIILLISATGLLVFTLIFALIELSMSRERLLDHLTVLAESVARNSTAAISFLDQESATDLLKALSADPDITAGAIIMDDKAVFARYPDQCMLPTPMSDRPGARFLLDQDALSLELLHPIMLDGQVIATLYLRSSLTKSKREGAYLLLIMLLDFILVLILVMLASRRLQYFITRPVIELADTMKAVTDQGNYTVQATPESEDEIGQLVHSFNAMLSAICSRDGALQTHQLNLELLVEQRTQELKHKHDEALHLAQAKSDFLAHMSHELRTPLNAIIGMSHLLKHSPLTQKQQDYVQTLYASSNLLLGSINNVLDFSKLEAGKVELDSVPFQLSMLWSQLSSLLSAKATAKGLALHFPEVGEVTDTVLGDPMRLIQILVNLVDNAIKFTDRGVIRVATEVLIRGPETLLLHFSVSDSGIGLESAQIELLFQPFSQVTSSRRRRDAAGTGLGLAICKQLVMAMGGTISGSSQPGGGSLFSFTVRLSITADRRIPGLITESAQGDDSRPLPFAGSHILLVEDTAANRFVVEELLHLYGIVVTSVETGEAALKIIKQQTFDLLLMDIQMPIMDGCETARHLRCDARYQMIPIIAMTAHALSGDRERFLACGMNDYLAKPFHPEQLEGILHKWLQPQSDASGAAMLAVDNSKMPQPTCSLSGLPEGFNLAQGLAFVDHKPHLYRRTLQIFAEDYYNVDQSIQSALQRDDVGETRRLLHNLDGASRLIGWVKVTALTQSLQNLLEQQQLQLFSQQLQQLKAELNQAIPMLLRLADIDSLDQTG